MAYAKLSQYGSLRNVVTSTLAKNSNEENLVHEADGFKGRKGGEGESEKSSCISN